MPSNPIALGQSTIPMQMIYASMSGGRTRSVGRKRRSKRASSSSSTRRRRKTANRSTSRRSRGIKRLVKGSAAAKRHMARIRKMRKK